MSFDALTNFGRRQVSRQVRTTKFTIRQKRSCNGGSTTKNSPARNNASPESCIYSPAWPHAAIGVSHVDVFPAASHTYRTSLSEGRTCSPNASIKLSVAVRPDGGGFPQTPSRHIPQARLYAVLHRCECLRPSQTGRRHRSLPPAKIPSPAAFEAH